MPDLDYANWPAWVWAVYAFGALYLVGFFAFFVRIERAARRAQSGEASDVEAYNRLVRGFPNSLYARMMGRKPLQAQN